MGSLCALPLLFLDLKKKNVEMGFGNLKSDGGVQTLNSFLEDKSYVSGYVPSQADVAVYEGLGSAPNSKYCHALRWYNHVTSYASMFASLPGVKQALESYGPSASNGNAAPADDDEDDDDDDLFGSDDEEETAEQERIKAKRVAAYQARKANKKVVIAKSNIVLDVKPWDDETDMAEMERQVRSIEADGLLWGAAKLVAIGYGIKKLQISCVVEDDKISTDFLEEEICAFEEHVQSVDIAAFNKV